MSVIFYVLGVFVLNRINKKTAVIFATHPLVIIEGLVNSHNDLIGVSLAFIGIYFLFKNGNKILTRLFLLLSAGIKYFTFPALFLTKKNQTINKFLFFIFFLFMIFLSLDREIQPWYFLSFFVFLPFFEEILMKFNFFTAGLLFSNYFFVRYGVMNEAMQLSYKNIVIFVFLTFNVGYLFINNYIIREPSKKYKIVLIICLIAIAIISRFHLLSKTAYFVNDQGRDMTVLYQMLVSHKFTLVGSMSTFGPYYYFLLPFFAISKNPLFLTGIFPALFVIGLLLVFKVKQLHFWEKIFFAVLIISSWYSLFYTRFLWNLNLAFLLSFILLLLFLINKEKIKSFWILVLLFGFIAGAVMQIYYGMIFLYVALIYFFREKKRNIILYSLGIIISFFPFALFDYRHGGVIVKNFLSLLISSHPTGDLASFLIVFQNIYDFYLFPFVNLPVYMKIITASIIYLGVIIFLLKRKSELSRFLLITYIIFPISYFIFKRALDYYLACFFIWFYLGLSLTLYSLFQKKGILRYGSLLFILLFFIINFIKYFSLPGNTFAIETQKNIAGTVAFYERKWVNDELNKGHKVKKSDKVQISVYPHQDDIRGVEYILKSEYNLNVVSQNKRRYVVCYFDYCKTEQKYLLLPSGEKIIEDDTILLYDEKNVKVYVFR